MKKLQLLCLASISLLVGGCAGSGERYALPCEIKDVTIKVVPDEKSATTLWKAYGGDGMSDLGTPGEKVRGFAALEEKVLVLTHRWTTWWEEITHLMDHHCLKPGRKKKIRINR